MTLQISPTIWAITLALYAVLFVVDLLVVGRRPHEPTMAECARWLGLFSAIAIVFGIALGVTSGRELGVQFFAGWITEYSLSVDNLFVFIVIMASFQVPRPLQQAVLFYGIVIALALRALFIVAGAAAIQRYNWVFYLFGVFLVYTAVRLASHGADDDEQYEQNRLVRWIGRHINATDEFHGTKLRVEKDGVRFWTPMLLVLLAIGTTDLVFALDSIPAIFGLTKEPYIVFAANVFALLGLRQMYFLLGGLLQRLIYLSVGLSIVLGFIGVKLFLEALHTNQVPFINGGEPVNVPVPSIGMSLAVIVGVLAATTIASVLVSRSRRGTA